MDMNSERPYAGIIERLKEAGLRPTRQRLALARMLFDGPDRHVTAEALHGEVMDSNIRVSLATVYNTLHQFTRSGLLREVVVDSGRAYFDTNMSDHHHIFDEDNGRLTDIAPDDVTLSGMPALPAGSKLSRIDVVLRVRSSAS
jgi:Fur family iron response transcriptional regulator